MDKKRITKSTTPAVELSRREALARLGLCLSIAYLAPAVLTLSQPAYAGSGGGGGGDDNAAPRTTGASPGTAAPRPVQDIPETVNDIAPRASRTGSPFGAGVEQVGPDLTTEEEAAAIKSGWQ
ncbi:MAG: hypothetical protein ACE5JZ_07055 [Kiloniellales bacterium]